MHENTLIVTGKAHKDEEDGRYLHRGIARRAFERRFSLADHIKVTGASLDNGLLHVDLVREVPEAMKPRQIAIAGAEPTRPQVTEQKAAARPTSSPPQPARCARVAKRPRSPGAFFLCGFCDTIMAASEPAAPFEPDQRRDRADQRSAPGRTG